MGEINNALLAKARISTPAEMEGDIPGYTGVPGFPGAGHIFVLKFWAGNVTCLCCSRCGLIYFRRYIAIDNAVGCFDVFCCAFDAGEVLGGWLLVIGAVRWLLSIICALFGGSPIDDCFLRLPPIDGCFFRL